LIKVLTRLSHPINENCLLLKISQTVKIIPTAPHLVKKKIQSCQLPNLETV
jgi:hypothetical protein